MTIVTRKIQTTQMMSTTWIENPASSVHNRMLCYNTYTVNTKPNANV